MPGGWARAAAVGVLAGFLSGLFGVGGGIFIVPALVLLLSLDQRLAHGTSLAAAVPISAVAALGYAAQGLVDWPIAALVLGGSAVGVVGGTALLRVLSQRGLRLAFVGVLLATAGRLLVAELHSGTADMTVAVALGALILGLVAGVLSGLLGVGGGIIMVPAFIVAFGLSDVLAKGTSLVVIVPTAIVGTLRNRGSGNVDLRVAVVVGACGAASAYPGVAVATRLDERLSVALLAGLLLLTAVRLAWQDVTDLRARAGARRAAAR